MKALSKINTKKCAKLIKRYKYKNRNKNKLAIYDTHICFSEIDENGSDRWFFLKKGMAIKIAKNILKNYAKEEV